jgi:hypothetical protein
MLIGVFLQLAHAFFDVFPELLKIDVEVSFDGREPIDDNLFDELPLEPIQLLCRVHLVNHGDILIQTGNLTLASRESLLQLHQLLL